MEDITPTFVVLPFRRYWEVCLWCEEQGLVYVPPSEFQIPTSVFCVGSEGTHGVKFAFANPNMAIIAKLIFGGAE